MVEIGGKNKNVICILHIQVKPVEEKSCEARHSKEHKAF